MSVAEFEGISGVLRVGRYSSRQSHHSGSARAEPNAPASLGFRFPVRIAAIDGIVPGRGGSLAFRIRLKAFLGAHLPQPFRASTTPEAVALRDWLVGEGWTTTSSTSTPRAGSPRTERWERRLYEAANRCEAVVFLVSRAWLQSEGCLRELTLAEKLDKRIFEVLIEEVPRSRKSPRDDLGVAARRPRRRRRSSAVASSFGEVASGSHGSAQLGVQRLASGKAKNDMHPIAPPALGDGRISLTPGAGGEFVERPPAGFSILRPVDRPQPECPLFEGKKKTFRNAEAIVKAVQRPT